MLGSWSIAFLHLSSRCFLLMRSAEGCIIGLASVHPNFLRLTFDPQAGGASLSLSNSCQVSPAAEETHQAAASRCVPFPRTCCTCLSRGDFSSTGRRGCHLSVIRVTPCDLWLLSRRVEYQWRDGKGSTGHVCFDAVKLLLRAVVAFVLSARCPRTHSAWIDLFSVLSCSRGGFLSEGVFMVDFIVHEASTALKFLWFSSPQNMLTPFELCFVGNFSLFLLNW